VKQSGSKQPDCAPDSFELFMNLASETQY